MITVYDALCLLVEDTMFKINQGFYYFRFLCLPLSKQLWVHCMMASSLTLWHT